MNSSNQRKLTRVVCLVLAAVLLLSLVSTALIMLVSAFCGYEHTMEAYKIAVQEKYRFFSFGDAMLII